MKTVLETIRSGTPWLEKAGIENARLNMEHLLAKVLGCRRLQLYMDFDRPLGEAELGPLRELVRRRREGEPLQHLLGSVEFMGREFRCDARALIPRPETEELVERILGRVKRQGGAPPQAVLDMGTGSGVIGLSLAAAWPEARVVLADMSPDALALAQENAEALGLAGERLTFLLTDLCAALGGQRFHVVAANLPYIDPDEIPGLAPEVQRDPLLALDGGPGGTAVIRRFLDALPPHLEPGALLALEVGEGQTAGIAEGLRAAGFDDVAAESDLGQRDRFVFARWP